MTSATDPRSTPRRTPGSTPSGGAVLERYLDAQDRGDLVTASALLADDAVVVDDGAVHRGRAEVDAWLRRAREAFSYTAVPTGPPVLRDGLWTATRHLEGNFPGGAVDLEHSAVVRGGVLASLTTRAV